MLCVLVKILSHASGKKKTKRLTDFKFCNFIGSFSGDIMAVKGLKWGCSVGSVAFHQVFQCIGLLGTNLQACQNFKLMSLLQRPVNSLF